MNHSLALLIGLTVFAALGLRSSADEGPVALQSPVERHGRLSVKGNAIVDEHGRPVVLRGMSLFWSQWGGQYYNADCVKWLRDDWHCTVVRAAIGVGSGGDPKKPPGEGGKGQTGLPAATQFGVYPGVGRHAPPPPPPPP